jgi:hypothetical protein
MASGRRVSARAAVAVTFLLGAVLFSACGANFAVEVDVGLSGQGSVTLTVTLPKATAAGVEDLKAGLPVADLRAAGWVVTGPASGQGGKVTVEASHRFSRLAQVPALVADIAGSGPERSRPFRLAVSEDRQLLHDRFAASGAVDLRCGLACFDDAQLLSRVGYPLGLPPAEVARLLANPAKELTFRFLVVLPGKASSTNAASRTSTNQGPQGTPLPAGGPRPQGAAVVPANQSTPSTGQQSRTGRSRASSQTSPGVELIWVPVLGRATPIAASSDYVRTAVIEQLAVAVGGGTVLVLATAGFLLWRRRHRRRRGGPVVHGRERRAPAGFSSVPPRTLPRR